MVVFLAGCGGESPESLPSANTTQEAAALSTENLHKQSIADEQDLIRDWVALNGECKSNSNTAPGACELRDRLQETIEERGWCSSASFLHPSKNNYWHKCDAPNVPASFGEESGQQKTISMIIADAIMEENERDKTPLLHAYEKAIAPLAQREGMANAVTKCGIRGALWRQQVQAAIRTAKDQSRLQEMRVRLSPEDLNSAEKYYANSVKMPELWYLGGGERDELEACREMADMPLVQNDAVFFP